jgi:NADH dehydrogenase
MPTNRIRIATDWALDVLLPRQLVQIGLVRGGAVPLAASAPEHPIHEAGAAAREGS